MSKIDLNEIFDLRMGDIEVGKRYIVGFLKGEEGKGVVLATESDFVVHVGEYAETWASKECECWIPVDSLEFPKPELPRAKTGELFYYLDECGEVMSALDYRGPWENEKYEMGNYYLTEEEAKEASGQLVEWFKESKERRLK